MFADKTARGTIRVVVLAAALWPVLGQAGDSAQTPATIEDEATVDRSADQGRAVEELLAEAAAEYQGQLELELARYYEDRWHHPEAARRASQILTVDPGNLEAHRIYMRGWSYMHGEPVILEQYRTLLEEAPSDPTRRVLRAMSLASKFRMDSEDCVEIEQMLAPLPRDPDLQYHALRVLHRAHDGACPGDSAADQKRILDLDGQTTAGEGWILWSRLLWEPIDSELRDRLRDRYQRFPWDLVLARQLWRDGARGPALRQARRDALDAARAHAADDRLVVVQAAFAVLDGAGRSDEAEDLETRLEELDKAPEWRVRLARENDLLDRVRAARKMLSSELGLDRLAELEPEIPVDGSDRAAFEMARVHHLDELGRVDEALEARRLAWLADPDAPIRANDFAYRASLAGIHLDDALRAIDGAIRLGEEEVYDRTEWDGSVDHAQRREWDNKQLGAWRDTRAWVLYRLGRHEEAAAEMRAALRLVEDSTLHLHMGLIYAALGMETPAADHLALGLARGGGEPELAVEARSTLELLADGQGWWHPDGLDGHLAVLGVVLREGPSEPAAATARSGPTSPHGLVGAAFPDLEVKVAGKRKRQISDYPGVRVVDIWATWCSPCVAGLPHLDQVASSYADRGVTVLAVSVDDDYAKAEEIFQGVPTPRYERVWAPDAMGVVDVKGIPAVFILDPDGVVVDFIQGGGSEDTRIDEALDRLLEELEVGAPTDGP
jgi:thiol-disulfide isomerase/thioredoxin/tetratricopeptide (TPR) repeat protein